MSDNSKPKCTFCEKTYSSKYTLETHIFNIHKIKIEKENNAGNIDLNVILKCSSKNCDFETIYKYEMKKHIKRCKILLFEKEREKAKKECDIEYNSLLIKLKNDHATDISRLKNELIQSQLLYEKQISSLKTEKNILQKELDKAQQMIQTLSEKAINRPSNITQQHNEIGNVRITNHLSDHKSYLKQLHPERVTEMLQLHFEKYFMDGQSGLARFVVEHIIRLKDGKMILCCTDPARKRFRFIDADGKLAEDVRAKMFRSKIKIPVREMCNEVFDRIIDRIKDEKKVKISAGDAGMEVEFLEKKIDMAERRFFEIRAFDGDDGTEFLNELTSLLRNPYETEYKEYDEYDEYDAYDENKDDDYL